MPYKFRRVCPICHRQKLLYLADHLRQVHNLSSEERQPLLKSAIHGTFIRPSMGRTQRLEYLLTLPNILLMGVL